LKIKQVVINIISNAIQYNERKGKIEVIIERKGNDVLFSCHNTGIGIGPEEKKKIFTKFYRSEKAMAMVAGGSGLGLFISKAIIEKSQGKIWFKSKAGQGSTFYFSLPIKKYAK
ncbi:MAG: ATP-binding protein, partial [bacterium]